MEERLIALIAHLVVSGLDVEQALEHGRSYVKGQYAQAYAFIPIFPSQKEQFERDAQTLADETVEKVILKAWIATEQLRKEPKT